MKRVKGCLNDKCAINQQKITYPEKNKLCPKCGNELVYVCDNIIKSENKKCYDPLDNELDRYCRTCLAIKRDNNDKVKDKLWSVAKTGVGAIGGGLLIFTFLNVLKDEDKKSVFDALSKLK